MYGAQIAFKDYRAVDGIVGSRWVGLANYTKFFNNYLFERVIKNTLGLSLYSLIAGFPIPIILALLINGVSNRYYKKTIQMVTYAPYFISTVVLVGMMIQFLSPYGVYGNIVRLFGLKAENLISRPENFKSIYVWSGIWQTAGWNSIVYIAALTGIDPTLYEAATIDGASKLKRIIYIDLPGILPTAVILLIINTGYIMDVGFEKVFLLQNNLNLSASEVITTYVYKIGLSSGSPDYSYSTAVGLFNSVVNFSLILIVNKIARKLSNTSIW